MHVCMVCRYVCVGMYSSSIYIYMYVCMYVWYVGIGPELAS